MSSSLFNDPGYIGCNYCGIIKVFNKRKPRIIWALCKSCNLIYSKGGKVTPCSSLPGSMFSRPPNVDYSGPRGYSMSNDHFYWEEFNSKLNGVCEIKELVKIKDDAYHLLDYKPNEDRCIKTYMSLHNPEIMQFVDGFVMNDSDASSEY